MKNVDLEHGGAAEVEPVTLGRLARTLNSYRVPILLSLAAVVCGYVIIAAFVFLTSPDDLVTSQPFRLEFEGATVGLYPNGTKFSPSEIVSTPILARVYEANALGRFLPFNVFTKSVYVVEANAALERLTLEYQARLADPKLSPLDRDRIVREFESKKESISKDEYSLNFSAAQPAHRPPSTLVKKVLGDILREWAAYAAREQRVLQYQVAVLSPNIVPAADVKGADYIRRVAMLRSVTFRVLDNIDQIERLPGAKLARTQGDQLSLNDIRISLDDMVRFRLEPLVPALRRSGLVGDVGAAVAFAEAQLGYDERKLTAAKAYADVVRQAIQSYAGESSRNAEGSPTDTAAAKPAGEGVTPQLSETFLDRLMAIATATGDVAYRQKLIDDYRKASANTVPLEQAVAYDREFLTQLRSPAAGGGSMSAAEVEQQIAAVRGELQEALRKVNELYTTISRNLQPDTNMFTSTGVPTTRTQRTVRLQQLVGVGVLILFLAFPLILAAVLIHHRLRQENAVEERHHDVSAAPAA